MRKYLVTNLVKLAEWIAPVNRMDRIMQTGNWKL